MGADPRSPGWCVKVRATAVTLRAACEAALGHYGRTINLMKIITTLLLVFGLAGLALAASSKFPAISHDELKAAIAAKNVTLLDVNGSESFQEARIPGAIDYIANEKKIAALLPKDKRALIVAYCGNEYCPAYLAAATAAKELGYTNVKHYAPGIDGWKKSGAKVEKS
jgi:rhodanese-related sulfurtransferase